MAAESAPVKPNFRLPRRNIVAEFGLHQLLGPAIDVEFAGMEIQLHANPVHTLRLRQRDRVRFVDRLARFVDCPAAAVAGETATAQSAQQSDRYCPPDAFQLHLSLCSPINLNESDTPSVPSRSGRRGSDRDFRLACETAVLAEGSPRSDRITLSANLATRPRRANSTPKTVRFCQVSG